MTPTADQWASVQQQIRDLANTKYPTEACGFVFQHNPEHTVPPGLTAGGLYAVSVDNVAEWPYAQYRIRPEDTAWAMRTERCVAVWHSHPSDPAVPSELDQELAVPDIYQVIYAVQDEDMAVFLLEDGRLVPQAIVMPA